jgi:hypothetical protein
MKDELEALRGQQVEVIYNGLIYKGLLVGATEETIDLQTREQWIALPMEGVTSVKKAEEIGRYFGQDEGSGEPSL